MGEKESNGGAREVQTKHLGVYGIVRQGQSSLPDFKHAERHMQNTANRYVPCHMLLRHMIVPSEHVDVRLPDMGLRMTQLYSDTET